MPKMPAEFGLLATALLLAACVPQDGKDRIATPTTPAQMATLAPGVGTCDSHAGVKDNPTFVFMYGLTTTGTQQLLVCSQVQPGEYAPRIEENPTAEMLQGAPYAFPAYTTTSSVIKSLVSCSPPQTAHTTTIWCGDRWCVLQWCA